MGVIFSVLQMTITAVTLPISIFKNFMAIISFIFLGLLITLGVMIWKSWNNIYELYETVVGTGNDAKNGIVGTVDSIKEKVDELNAKLDSLTSQNIKSIQFK